MQSLLNEGCGINDWESRDLSPILTAAFPRPDFSYEQGTVDWTYIKKLIDLGTDIHVTSWKGNLAFAIVRNGAPEDWEILKKK